MTTREGALSSSGGGARRAARYGAAGSGLGGGGVVKRGARLGGGVRAALKRAGRGRRSESAEQVRAALIYSCRQETCATPALAGRMSPIITDRKSEQAP